MSPAGAMAVALFFPAAGALLVSRLDRLPGLRDAVSLAVGLLLFGSVASLLPAVQAGARPELEVIRWSPGMALAFQVEPLGLVFALVASGLWIVTTVYSIGYMRSRHELHQTRFYTCFALAIFAAIGVAFSANLITLFAFYELLTFTTYPLVTHHGTAKAQQGGRVYLGILLSTSIAFFLLAIVWTWAIAGTLDFREGGILAGTADPGKLRLLLMLFAFGIGKAALMPFHRWLPAAMVAPTPVSALLHAVAVVKAGVFTILKVAVYVFGIDLLADADISVWLMYVAAATILAASLIALTRDDLKERLAYSTISQLSYIVLGAALANASGVLGGAMHIVMHAFGKITLFFCAGAIYVATDKTRVSELDGLGRSMPVTMAAFAMGALCVIGLPPMGGAWSKWFLALGAVDAGQSALVAVLMISSLLNIAYLMPIPIRAFFREAPQPENGSLGTARLKEAPVACLLALSFTAIGSLVLFFAAGPLVRLLKPITEVIP